MVEDRRHRDVGFHGSGRPVLMSQRMFVPESSRGMSFHCRDEIDVLAACIWRSCCCSFSKWL